MRPRPLGISVVIPTFNRPVELASAIASVRTRTPARVEVIVVDDGSERDAAVPPARTADGAPVRLYRFERNRGPQAARNLGIRRARFSHVALLDSDDRFLPDKLDRVLAAIERTGADVVLHPSCNLGFYDRPLRALARLAGGRLPLADILAIANPSPTPSITFRRRLRLGPPSMRHCEDYAFMIHYCGQVTTTVYLDEPLAVVEVPLDGVERLSGDIWAMVRGTYRAKAMFLKTGGAINLARWAVGVAISSLIGAPLALIRARARGLAPGIANRAMNPG